MKEKFKKILRPLLFGVGGAMIGLLYYLLVGCPDGACAITSNPVNSMVYLGVIGLLFSMVSGEGCACSRDDNTCQ